MERDVEGEKRASQQKKADDTRTVSVDPRKRASVMEDVPGPRAGRRGLRMFEDRCVGSNGGVGRVE